MEQILDAIYGAAIDPSQWSAVLEAVALFCGLSSASIYRPLLPGVAVQEVEWFIKVGPDAPPDHGLYRTFADQDCFSGPMAALVNGDHRRVASLMATRPSDEQLHSAYYQEYLRAANYGDTMALMLRAPRLGQATPVLGLGAPWGGATISKDQMRRLQVLAPHLQRAARLMFDVAPGAPVDAGLRQAVEAADTPMLLLREDGRVGCFNASAEAIAVPVRGLSLTGGRLAALDPDVNERLQALIRRATRSGYGAGRIGGEMDVEGPDGGRVTCLILPLGGDNPFREGVGPCRAMVHLLAPGRDLARGPGRLRRLFDLSAAETEVAIALMSGASPEEIAVERGRSIETVRTQCRAILSKTGFSRASELTRLWSLVRPAEA